MALFNFKQLPGDSDSKKDGLQPEIAIATGHNSSMSGTGAAVIKELFGSIEKGQSIHYATSGHWNAHELLEHLIQKTGPAKLYLTTWAMSENPVRTILNLIDSGMITELNCVFDLKVQDRAPKVFQLIQGITSRVRLVHCHAKVFVLENESWGISNNGSANWTRNPRMESGVLSADPAVAKFHKNWIMKLINENHDSDS